MRLALVLPLLWSARLAHAACGDGVVDATEACDDADTDAGDGCDGSCAVEAGWACDNVVIAEDSTLAFYDPDGHDTPVWTLSTDGRSLTESADCQPGVYVTTLSATDAPLTFQVEVTTTTDDDFFGFTLGAAAGDDSGVGGDFLLVDWKQTDQVDSVLGTGLDGLAVSRVTGLPDGADLFTHTGETTELARATSLGSAGWTDNTPVEFSVQYDTTQLQIWVDGTLEIDVSGTFPDGNLGFYVFSQSDVTFSLVEPSAESTCQALDSDFDGLTDPDEVVGGTDPEDADSDDDGLTDGDEADYWGTDPLDPDTDDDGLSDAAEISETGTDPLDADGDDDGLSDAAEVAAGTDPLDADSDDDSLSDATEQGSTDPLDADSDDDGLEDGYEVTYSATDPLDADSDDDGLSDGDEVLATATDPNDPDTDGGGRSDYEEIAELGTDPLDPSDDADDGGADSASGSGDEAGGDAGGDGGGDAGGGAEGGETPEVQKPADEGCACASSATGGGAWAWGLGLGLSLLRRRARNAARRG